MNGVFQVDREIFENSIWNNIAEFRLFFYILGKAIWKDSGVVVGGIQINKGQYLRSYRNLREDLMYVENNKIKYYGIATIKRMVDKLVDDERLEIKETELGTLFTVVNYHLYQGFERFNNGNLEQQRNSNGTATEQQRNNKKKGNTVKTVNNKDIDAHFERMWKLYPVKRTKSQVKSKAKKEIYELGEEFERCISRYIDYVDSRRRTDFKELNYQNGSTFFNGGYIDYLDENYQQVKAQKKNQPKPFDFSYEGG